MATAKSRNAKTQHEPKSKRHKARKCGLKKDLPQNTNRRAGRLVVMQRRINGEGVSFIGSVSSNKKNHESMLQCFEVDPKNIPRSTAEEKDELLRILEKAGTNGEIDLSKFGIQLEA